MGFEGFYPLRPAGVLDLQDRAGLVVLGCLAGPLFLVWLLCLAVAGVASCAWLWLLCLTLTVLALRSCCGQLCLAVACPGPKSLPELCLNFA